MFLNLLSFYTQQDFQASLLVKIFSKSKILLMRGFIQVRLCFFLSDCLFNIQPSDFAVYLRSDGMPLGAGIMTQLLTKMIITNKFNKSA